MLFLISFIEIITKTIANILKIKQTKEIDKVGGAGGQFEIYACNVNRIPLMKGRTVLNEMTNPYIRVPLNNELSFVILGRSYSVR